MHDVALKSTEYRNSTVQILSTFLQSKASDFGVKEYVQDPSYDIKKTYEKWYCRPSVGTDSIKALQTLTELNFSDTDINQLFESAYKNFYLHGIELWEMPSHLFVRCDLSGCIIKCAKGTKFIACDLTNATIMFENHQNHEIFDSCNVSNIRLQVPNDVSPIINGWHWEGFPPRVANNWSFINSPKDRRIIKFDQRRVFPLSKLFDYYLYQEFGVPDNKPSFLFDNPSIDPVKQVLEPDKVEFNFSMNTPL